MVRRPGVRKICKQRHVGLATQRSSRSRNNAKTLFFSRDCEYGIPSELKIRAFLNCRAAMRMSMTNGCVRLHRYSHLLDSHLRYRMGIQGPELDVFLWTILQNQKDLAMEMWKYVRYPVRSAIFGECISCLPCSMVGCTACVQLVALAVQSRVLGAYVKF